MSYLYIITQYIDYNNILFLDEYKDIIKKTWNHNKYPYIAHGLRHHFQVAKNVILLSTKINIRDIDNLILASLLHDILRDHSIQSQSVYIQDIQTLLLKSFKPEKVEDIVSLIYAHNDINRISTLDQAAIYLADKLDYNFERGFLVQIYERGFKSKDVNLGKQITNLKSDLGEKNKKDLESIHFIMKKFNLGYSIYASLEMQYDEMYNKGILFIENIEKNPQVIKKELKELVEKNIIEELNINRIYKLHLSDYVIIRPYIDLATISKPRILKFLYLAFFKFKMLFISP